MKRTDSAFRFLNIFMALLLLPVFFSCSKNQESEDRYLDLSNPKLVDVSDVVTLDKIIPLKNGGEPLMATLSKVTKVGDKFIGSDMNWIVYIFDNEGNLISYSEGLRGQGPGEYEALFAYSYNPYSNTVEIITPLKMKVYDLDFNFIEDRDIPAYMPTQDKAGCFFSEIYDLDENVHALIPSGVSSGYGSVVIYDSSKKETLNTIDCSSDLVGVMHMQHHSFTDLDDSIVFYPPGTSKYIYSLDKDSYSLNKEITIEGFEFEPSNELNDQYREYALNTTELMPIRFLVTDKKFGFLAKEGRSVSTMSYLFSNEDGTMDKFMIQDGDDMVFPLYTVTDGKDIYGLCDGENMSGIYSAMNLEMADSIKEYPSVLVRYSLK